MKIYASLKSAIQISQIAQNTQNSKHELKSNAQSYDSKTHWTDWEGSSTLAPTGTKLYC